MLDLAQVMPGKSCARSSGWTRRTSLFPHANQIGIDRRSRSRVFAAWRSAVRKLALDVSLRGHWPELRPTNAKGGTGQGPGGRALTRTFVS